MTEDEIVEQLVNGYVGQRDDVVLTRWDFDKALREAIRMARPVTGQLIEGMQVQDPETKWVYTYRFPGEEDPFTDESGARFTLAGVDYVVISGLPEESDIRPFSPGDHCRMLMLAGVQLVQHWDCDEFTDGTYTRNTVKGQAVVTAGTLRTLKARDAELKK